MLKKKNGSENKGMFWLGILAYPDYTAITKKKGSLWEYVIPALHKGPWTKTIRTKAFHPNLYPWKQKVTPPSYHNWQSPGSLTACLLSLSSNSSPASSVCVLGGGGRELPLKDLCFFLPNPPSPPPPPLSATPPSVCVCVGGGGGSSTSSERTLFIPTKTTFIPLLSIQVPLILHGPIQNPNQCTCTTQRVPLTKTMLWMMLLELCHVAAPNLPREVLRLHHSKSRVPLSPQTTNVSHVPTGV